MNSKYGFGKAVDLPFDKAVERVTQALQKEGFGVLTDIDVAATLKQKLGHDMPPYRILGACNPPLAHRAIEAEPSIGLLLPCNVVVRQDESGAVQVEIMDPNAVLDLVDKPAIAALAREVRTKLERALAGSGGEAPPARSAAAQPPAATEDDMQRMRAQMDKIGRARDAAERQRLMQEHLQTVRENLSAMRAAAGGGMHGKCMCCGR